MFHLIDTFNNKVISKHRSLEAALEAQNKFNKAIKNKHGANSFLPTKILFQ